MNAKNTGTTIDYTIYYMIIIYQYIIKRLKFISTDITPKDLSFLEPMLKKKNQPCGICLSPQCWEGEAGGPLRPAG